MMTSKFVGLLFCRKKQSYGGTRISNPAYEVTKDDNNMLSKVLKDRANSLDDGDPLKLK